MAWNWLQGWLDPRPFLPSYSGPYTVGSVDIEVPVDSLASGIERPDSSITTVACRVFYPTSPPDSQAAPSPVYWIPAPQREILSGYARFCGAGSLLATFLGLFPNVLNGITIPAVRNGPLAEAPTHDKRWPTLIFSHGLGGSRNAYSHMCGSLASYGLVVFALDHRDGSQAVAMMRQTTISEACRTEYRFMKHVPCEETFAGRDHQLAIRIWEICNILDAAQRIDTNQDYTELHTSPDGKNPSRAVLDTFKGRLAVHEPGAVAFAGHSFGGSTTVQLIKSAFYHSEVKTPLLSVDPKAGFTPPILRQVTARTPCLLLDPWAMPWTSPATSALAERPMPCFASTAVEGDNDAFIAILSVAFFKWRLNINGLKQILCDPRHDSKQHPHIFYPSTSAHLSQSDFSVLFPSLTRHLAGDVEPLRTMDLNLRGCLETLRRAGGRWASIAEKAPPADEVDSSSTNNQAVSLSLLEEGSQVHAGDCVGVLKGDSQILLRDSKIRGWVAVDFAEVSEEEEDAAQTSQAAKAAGLDQSDNGTIVSEPKKVETLTKSSSRKNLRVALTRARSSGRIRTLGQLATNKSVGKGHGRQVGKVLMVPSA